MTDPTPARNRASGSHASEQPTPDAQSLQSKVLWATAQAECLHSIEHEMRPTLQMILQHMAQPHWSSFHPEEGHRLLESIERRGADLMALSEEIMSLNRKNAQPVAAPARDRLESENTGNRENSQEQPGAQPMDAEALTLATQFPLRILVAEDNRINQQLMQHMLECFGYAATVVSDGLAVLDLLAQQDFDLIFMDVQMPRLNGLDTCQKILERYGPIRRPRIIATTAFGSPHDRRQCLNAGMDDYLAKPLDLGEMERVLMVWGSRLNSQQPPPQPVNPEPLNLALSHTQKSYPPAPGAENPSPPPLSAPLAFGPEPGVPAGPPGDCSLPLSRSHNAALLLKRLGNDPEHFNRLTTLFAEEGAALIMGIQQALADEALSPLQHHLHQLKGACSVMGGLSLRPVVLEMERHLRKQGLPGIEPLAEQLEQSWGLTLAELKALQAQWA